MKRAMQKKINDLKTKIRDYIEEYGSSSEKQLLEFALSDIDFYYQDQNRICGDPVVLHSLRIGFLLCLVEAGVSTVIAGLLHDLLEDTDISPDMIRNRYGEWYAEALDALSKAETQSQTHQKLLRAGRRDARFLVIKTFDRLDNMRDIHWLPADKRMRISKETKEFYLPVAKTIGISATVINELTARSNQFLS